MSKGKPENANKPKAERAKSKAFVKPEKENHSEINTPHSGIKKLTTDHSQLTTKMEVHHHPQLEHKHKPWKEYLIEGFMIFIAVMMGFIAENIREGIDNSEHVKQLTSQLVHDLGVDTMELDTVYRQETQILQQEDSLFALLQQPIQSINTIKLQKLVYDAHSLWTFHPSAVAIAAIKNELHLKQFSSS